MSKTPSIRTVLTDEGYQKFLDSGIGVKLSGTSYHPDDPANGLFWSMFRRQAEAERALELAEKDHDDSIASMADELARSEEIRKHQENYMLRQGEQFERLEYEVAQLEKTIVKLAVERTYDHARMEAMSDGF